MSGPTDREDARSILRRRAVALARPLVVPTEDADRVEVAFFSVGEARFALRTSFVREILPVPDVTPLPGSSRVLVGVTSIRGDLVPVAELAWLFGEAGSAPPAAAYVLVIGEDRAEVAVLASDVHEVALFSEHGLTPFGRERTLTRGVTHDGVVVLDGAALLSDPRLVVDERADSEATDPEGK